MNTKRLFILALALLVLPEIAVAVTPWVRVDAQRAIENAPKWNAHQGLFTVVELDITALEFVLRRAPLEGTPDAAIPVRLALPLPDGSFEPFDIIESPVMSPELQARFPQIRSYMGISANDGARNVRLDWSPLGFHAQIMGSGRTVLIDPVVISQRMLHVSHFKHDHPRLDRFVCNTEDGSGEVLPDEVLESRGSTVTLRVFRIAVAATNEYTNAQTNPPGGVGTVAKESLSSGIITLAARMACESSIDQR